MIASSAAALGSDHKSFADLGLMPGTWVSAGPCTNFGRRETMLWYGQISELPSQNGRLGDATLPANLGKMGQMPD